MNTTGLSLLVWSSLEPATHPHKHSIDQFRFVSCVRVLRSWESTLTHVCMCVLFTVGRSYSSIHTHLEIQMDKNSWCKHRYKGRPDEIQNYPRQNSIQKCSKKMFALLCEAVSSSRKSFLQLLVAMKCDFNRFIVWTLMLVWPAGEKVLCVHWCHVVYYASFLP